MLVFTRFMLLVNWTVVRPPNVVFAGATPRVKAYGVPQVLTVVGAAEAASTVTAVGPLDPASVTLTEVAAACPSASVAPKLTE